ncbi:MAG: N-acetylmuramoyl-L-alanine amidase [Clostridia bacterium]|nr:N-acetylmuramoyl-L-alanine amidase [Clostridia bacterium]
MTSGKIIVLDAGHGEFGNPYTCMEGKYEGTQNFILSLKMKAELEARGFTVLLTRNKIEDDPELYDRGALAGNNGAALFLSLHSNAPGHETPPDVYPTIEGVLGFYSMTDCEGNEPFAKEMTAKASEIMDTPDRGVQTRQYPDKPGVDYYGVIRASAQTGCSHAVLMEHGFHTNPKNAAFLTDDACLDKLAKAEAEIIEKYFG